MNITFNPTPDRQAALSDLLEKHNKGLAKPLTEQAYLAHVLHSSLDSHADHLVDAALQRVRTKVRAGANRIAAAESLFSKA